MKRNPLLDAAIDECRKAGVSYRYEATVKRHIKFFVSSSPRIVLIGADHASYDTRVIMNVRRDIVRSIKCIS